MIEVFDIILQKIVITIFDNKFIVEIAKYKEHFWFLYI